MRPRASFRPDHDSVGYAGDVDVQGYVIVDQKLYENSGVSPRYVDGRGCYVRVDGRLSNLEAGATGGFHVHAGTSCANVTAAGVDPVGGHYYEGDYARDDPWTVVEWTTSSSCGPDCDNEGAAFEFAFGLEQGRTRVIQRRFNLSVPRAPVLETASTLRDRSER